MKKLYLIAITTLMYFLCHATRPEELFYDALSVRQIPGSEKEMVDYFKPFNVEDTVYAIIFPTANCPRCENAIMPIFESLKKVNPRAQTALITAYHDSIAAKEYNQKFNLKADLNIYDISNELSKFLNFSIGDLHIPYFLKIDAKNGVLLTGFPAESNSYSLMKMLVDLDEPMQTHLYPIAEMIDPSYEPPLKTIRFQDKYKFTLPDKISLSEIYLQPDTRNNLLAFNDKLLGTIQLFELDTTSSNHVVRWKREIKCNDKESRRFITAPDSLTKSMYANNEMKYMALSPVFMSGNKIAISYSLPNIWQIGPWEIGYKNEPSVLVVDLDNDSIRNLYSIPDEMDSPFYEAHFQLYDVTGKLGIACKRCTWPLSVDVEDYQDKPDMNPFSTAFYSYRQPILTVMDFEKNGNMRIDERIGNLPDIAKQSLTGYYFVSPILDSFKNEVVISDGFSGIVTIYKSDCLDCPKGQYSIFNVPLTTLPEPDANTFHTYECTTPYKSILCRKIHDLKITDDKICAIVRYGELNGELQTDRYSVVTIDRSSGHRTELSLPNPAVDERLMAVGLWNIDNNAKPYMIVSKSGQWFVQI